MRILFVAPYIPSRIRVRPFQFIKGLAARHEVRVLALGGSDSEHTDGIDDIRKCTASFDIVGHGKLTGYAQSLVALPTMHPMCTAFCWSSAMKSAVRNAISKDKYDVIHIEHLRAAHFAPFDEKIPVVFDSVDCLTGLFGQMAKKRKNPLAKMLMYEESIKLKRYEPAVIDRFDGIIITSESESQALKQLGVKSNITVVPNGVDADFFSIEPDLDKRKKIVFSGKMSYSPNSQAAKWFADNVFPKLSSYSPGVEYAIIGSGPPQDLLALQSHPGISVTGYVEDIREPVRDAMIAVAPMQIAVGIQNKVLEAMAMGLPVIVSSAAARAFGTNCPGLITADTADEVIAASKKLLDNPREAQAIGNAGRKVVSERFSWDRSVHELEIVYNDVIAHTLGA